MESFIRTLILRLDDTGAAREASLAALKRLEGEQKRRIHQRGLDSKGNQLKSFAAKRFDGGRYSIQWGAKRAKAGRRTDRKNLEFSSQGNFRRSYTVGTFEGRFVYGFLNDKARLIAQGQQGQTRTIIFSPSDTERKNMLEVYATVLANSLSR